MTNNIKDILEKMKVVSDEEAEKCEYLICASADVASPFDDNLTGFCCKCGHKVIYRWHAPRKPKRICMQCFAEEQANESRRVGKNA